MSKDSSDRNGSGASRQRKRYAPPRIEETGSFERLVLGCVHQPSEGFPDDGSCGPPPPDGQFPQINS